MKILSYYSRHDPNSIGREYVTQCPYKPGVTILSPKCRACEYYDGECITQHMRCKYEDREYRESTGSDKKER